jgi:hypothetical protein
LLVTKRSLLSEGCLDELTRLERKIFEFLSLLRSGVRLKRPADVPTKRVNLFNLSHEHIFPREHYRETCKIINRFSKRKGRENFNKKVYKCFTYLKERHHRLRQPFQLGRRSCSGGIKRPPSLKGTLVGANFSTRIRTNTRTAMIPSRIDIL